MKNTINVLKFRTLNLILFWPIFLLFVQLFLKILGMANGVDPDQTSPSDLGLHCLHM